MKQNLKTQLGRRLKLIEGQVRGLERMVNRDTYCVEIITQSMAVKEALSGVEDLLLKNHLETHVAQQFRSGKSGRAVEEIVKVYKLAKKK